MRVRARTREWEPSVQSPVPAGVPFRRTFIYPHRSFRRLPLTSGRIALGLTAAFLLSLTFWFFAGHLLDLHQATVGHLLAWTGIPMRGWTQLVLSSWLPSTSTPLIPIPDMVEVEQGLWLAFLGLMLGLLYLHHRFPLLRTLVFFCIVLLLASAGSVVLRPDARLDSASFTKLWLRSEYLVWLVLPWISALMFVVFQPRAITGVLWIAGLQAYAVVFSALRLALCLGILHYSGTLFVPLLWFVFGLLAIVTLLLVAYSVSLAAAVDRRWGRRRAWQG